MDFQNKILTYDVENGFYWFCNNISAILINNVVFCEFVSGLAFCSAGFLSTQLWDVVPQYLLKSRTRHIGF